MSTSSPAQSPSPLPVDQPSPPAADDQQQNDNGVDDEIEADDNYNLERDSAFGDNASQSSRTSLTSGITKYREEHGRRYHAYRDGKYLFPNDDQEQDRLDLHHHVFNLVFDGKLFHAPIDKPTRVLDAGTGTGIWAIDFADQYPASHIIGCDLSPIQPGWIPPNLEFEIDDIEDVWRHSAPFSYVHLRSLGGSLKDWPFLLSQAYTHLEPGGYLEVVEFEVWVYVQNEGVVGKPEMIEKWQKGLKEAGEKIGRSFEVARRLKGWLEEAGFEEVRESILKVPNTPWPKDRRQKEIGLYQQQNMLDASSSYGQAHFTRVLGWRKEEYDVLSAGVRNELKNMKYHLYSNLHVVYGQKPKE
ncbi:TAM domain methyltransferase [Tricladium varicosporioides]|nr:TAM domain methyltransferase [Hymenoscyphus varicosporioides]